MRRRDKAGGKAIKTQRLKTLKRLKASKIARRRKSIATGKETNVERLTRELAGAVTEQEQLTQELLRRKAYLAEAQRLSQTGSWAWSPDQDITYWSEECYRVLSFDPQDGLPRFEEFFRPVRQADCRRDREGGQGDQVRWHQAAVKQPDARHSINSVARNRGRSAEPTRRSSKPAPTTVVGTSRRFVAVYRFCR
jgi:PAS domain-containing protein